MHNPDEEIIQNALWVLSSITENSEEACNIVINVKVLEKIINFVNHKDYEIKLPSILIVGHIAAGNDNQTTVVISLGGLTALTPLIDSPKKDIRKESLWALSNFSAGNENHIACMINEGVFPRIIRILYRDDAEVTVEALWALANAAGKGTKEQVLHLIKSGVIPALIHCLSVKEPNFLKVVLLGIKKILESGAVFSTESGVNPYVVIFEECGGVGRLEKLQQHRNSKVFQEAYRILETYFGAKCEDQDLLDMIISSANLNINNEN